MITHLFEKWIKPYKVGRNIEVALLDSSYSNLLEKWIKQYILVEITQKRRFMDSQHAKA